MVMIAKTYETNFKSYLLCLLLSLFMTFQKYSSLYRALLLLKENQDLPLALYTLTVDCCEPRGLSALDVLV